MKSIKVTRNPDYWKPGRPYLDGIEYTFKNIPSTAILAFAAGKFDRAWQGIMSLPLMKQLKDRRRTRSDGRAVEHPAPTDHQPQQAAVRQCGATARDGAEPRSPGFHRHSQRRSGRDRRRHDPPPAGSWGMPPEVLQDAPGLRLDVAKNRAEAREIMKKLGYGPDKRLAVT